MANPKHEICTIRIMFPVDSDERAIEYKKKIQDILADSNDVNMQFGIMSMPPQPNGQSIPR